MSYVRFGEQGSDVYVFWHAAEGDTAETLVCWSCQLLTDPLHYHASTFTAMLAHLAQHRVAGHVVPEYVDAELLADRDTTGDDPTMDVP